jgi:excinuclease ABC subunit C
LDFVRDHFRLRTCDPLPSELCLRYHVHKCSGICTAAVHVERYAHDVERSSEFLTTNTYVDVIREMKRRMHFHTANLKFESAGRLKEQVAVLEQALEKQVVERDVTHDQDVIYFGDRHALVAMITRGALQGMTLFDLEPATQQDEACQRFILSRYASGSPAELLVNHLSDVASTERSLRETNGYAVNILVPEKGAERELLDLCRINYEYRVSQKWGRAWREGHKA